jgi:hypothetical protein
MGAERQFFECMPPRRGAVIALAVDSTARAYDLVSIALGGYTPFEAQNDGRHVTLWLQAETADVYFYFAPGEVGAVVTTDIDDVSDTASITAGNAIAFANTYGARLVANNGPLPIRINRAVDRFLVVKAASTAGVLRFWASSASE